MQARAVPAGQAARGADAGVVRPPAGGAARVLDLRDEVVPDTLHLLTADAVCRSDLRCFSATGPTGAVQRGTRDTCKRHRQAPFIHNAPIHPAIHP